MADPKSKPKPAKQSSKPAPSTAKPAKPAPQQQAGSK